MQFRLADLDLRWTGTDDTTPEGHVIAVGLDPVGNTRVFLWAGQQPADEHYRGSLLLRENGAIAYGPRGSYVTSTGEGHAEMLARLADLCPKEQ